MKIHDVWGQIKVEKGFEKIIASKEFEDMKDKTQLGFNTYPTSVHTRYLHCLGTYHIACLLVNTFKEKFSLIIDITKEDEQAVECVALIHDACHSCFSHGAERCLEGNHEEKLTTKLLDETSELHQAILTSFGKEVLKKVIFLMNIINKEEKIEKGNIDNDKLFLVMMANFLSGNIDVDRIDFVFRDSKYVTGEVNDFSKIFDSMELETIDDELKVVYSGDVEYTIIDFLNKRFELYDTVYFMNVSRILESMFQSFINLTNYPLTWDTSEIEMKNYFRECLKSQNEVVKRYAYLLGRKKVDENIIIYETNDNNSYELLKNRLLHQVPELNQYSECLLEDYCFIRVYKKENPIFIKKYGRVQDLSDSTEMFNPNLTKEKYLIAIDLFLLRRLMEKDGRSSEDIEKAIKKIKKLTSQETEYEKKYLFRTDSEKHPKESFKQIKEDLQLGDAEYVENSDTYYDDEFKTLEKERITLRKRIVNGKEEFTVKRPKKDKSSITERDEKDFDTLEDALMFLQTAWNMPITYLEEVIDLKTLRAKYILEFRGGIFEIVFDKTTPVHNGVEYKSNYMLECELKEGSSAGLYFINKLIKQYPFIKECNLSKKEVGLQTVADGLTKDSTRKRKKDEEES